MGAPPITCTYIFSERFPARPLHAGPRSVLGPGRHLGDAGEIVHEPRPLSPADPAPETVLGSVPSGNGLCESGSAYGRQHDLPLPPVLARPALDPALSLERLERPGQRRAVDDEQPPEASLRDVPGQSERLEQRELRDGQARPSQLLVVDLAHRPRGPAQVRAGARQDAKRRSDLLPPFTLCERARAGSICAGAF